MLGVAQLARLASSRFAGPALTCSSCAPMQQTNSQNPADVAAVSFPRLRFPFSSARSLLAHAPTLDPLPPPRPPLAWSTPALDTLADTAPMGVPINPDRPVEQKLEQKRLEHEKQREAQKKAFEEQVRSASFRGGLGASRIAVVGVGGSRARETASLEVEATSWPGRWGGFAHA